MAGLIFGVLLITITTLLIMRVLRRKKSDLDQDGGTTVSGQSVQPIEGSAIRDSCSGSTESLEKNPDIIPQGKSEFYIF